MVAKFEVRTEDYLYSWYLYKMVAQNTARTYRVKLELLKVASIDASNPIFFSLKRHILLHMFKATL